MTADIVNQWYELGDGGYKFVASVTPEKMEKLVQLCALHGFGCKPILSPPKDWLLKERLKASKDVADAVIYLHEIDTKLSGK